MFPANDTMFDVVVPLAQEVARTVSYATILFEVIFYIFLKYKLLCLICKCKIDVQFMLFVLLSSFIV